MNFLLTNRIRWILLLALCLLVAPVKSRAQRFPFFNLKIEHGLAQSQVYCMAQDTFGNLWIGTLGGISRYDGKKFINYTNSDGLLSNTVQSMQFDRAGRLIVATSEGLQSFDGQKFTTIPTVSGGFSSFGFGLTKDQQILYCAKGSVYKTDRRDRPYLSLPEGKMAFMLQQVDSQLYVADNLGDVYVYLTDKPGTPRQVLHGGDHALTIFKILRDSKGDTWFLCNNGLFRQQGDRIEPYIIPRFGRSINVPLLSGAEDHNGQIWLGTVSGVLRLNSDGEIRYFNEQTGLSNNIIYSVLTDKEGNVWFGSDGQGIFRYSGGPFITLDKTFGLPDNQVTGVAGDEQGKLFLAGYSGKLSEYMIGDKVHELDAAVLGGAMISSIAYQSGRGLWVAARGRGLFLYRDGRTSAYPLQVSEGASMYIASLFADNENRLWVNMGRELLYLEGEKQIKVLGDSTITESLTQAGRDSILIASSQGLLLYTSNQLRRLSSRALPDSLHIQCMTTHGTDWILGTSDAGIVIYDTRKGQSRIFNKRNGLSSDFIYNIAADSVGNIFAGTGMGISRISFDPTGKASVINYSKANGVAGLESNANAVFVSRFGHIWFGTTEGACCYIPSARTVIARPVSIVLESVKLFGGKEIPASYYEGTEGWYHIPASLDLPYQHNNISFSFQAITLSPADKILYRYKLKGTDAPWSEWSPENNVNLSALDPGTYTFMVECSINGRSQGNAALNYTFRIKTPFHKSVWFIFSILSLAILLGVYLQYAANKRKQNRIKREQELRREEQVRVRERTAEDFHDEVGNKLTRINVLTNILKAKLPPDNSDAERIIRQIQDNTQQLYSGTRDILWSLQSSNDNLFEIVNHVRDLAGELFSETDTSFALSGNLPTLKEIKMPLDKSRNFIMIWKEALNNALKYAHAQHIVLSIQADSRFISVSLTDDGDGFDEEKIRYGNGLKNMKARAARMGGHLEVSAAANKGTKILLQFPYS